MHARGGYLVGYRQGSLAYPGHWTQKTANLGHRQTLPEDSLNIRGRLRHFPWQTSPLPKGYPKGWHNLIQFAGTPGGRERIPLKSEAADLKWGPSHHPLSQNGYGRIRIHFG